MVKIGGRVRVIGIPETLPSNGDDGGLNTAALFRSCLGRTFPVIAIDELGHAELHVGEVRGRKAFMDSIWIESEFLLVL
jgi:hypothetical protein